MTDPLTISLKLSTDDADDIKSLKKAVKRAILKSQQDFHPLFERLIDMGDARMTVMGESLYIGDCHINADLSGGEASGEFNSDFYAGCKDMNSTGDHEVTLPFTIDDETLYFEIEIPPRWVPDDHMG